MACIAAVTVVGARAGDAAFASAPTAFTYNPANVAETTATLQGLIGTTTAPTDCRFEYGSTPALGLAVACSSMIPTGVGVQTSAVITGLAPGAIYYDRLVASNAEGTGYGQIGIFQATRPPLPELTPEVAQPPARRYVPRRRRTVRTNPNDAGLYIAYCPVQYVTRRSHRPRARTSNTSHAGWPPKQCLKMDKGPPGQHHKLVGLANVHNWLLGGYGNDTIYGGSVGDVIWGDYHPDEKPAHQTAIIHAGDGRNVIYANDTVNYVWTGSNPKTVVHAFLAGTSGVIHCQSPGIVVYLSKTSQHQFKLDGCRRISHYSVGY